MHPIMTMTFKKSPTLIMFLLTFTSIPFHFKLQFFAAHFKSVIDHLCNKFLTAFNEFSVITFQISRVAYVQAP